MRNFAKLVLVSVFGGIITLGSYKLFLEEDYTMPSVKEFNQNTTEEASSSTSPFLVSNKFSSAAPENVPNFREAANKTVHAVVHVKNMAVYEGARNIWEYYYGKRQKGKTLRGAGSGVIITPDGYIVTNNHVIKDANEIQITLNNNITYKAELVGVDPQADIALLKIDAKDLDYIPFGDSDNVKIGDWALAVGNPFNLTSTVTAGIISAKGRDLNEGDARMQSFIQTDAAINPGNSGGALVNTNGELIGINTAITSQTGSYIGYGFAVPSNNARKIVEDLLEYGDVQQAIIGITGQTLNPKEAKSQNLSIAQGVRIASVSEGAKDAGLKRGDLITKVDGVKIKKLSDLTSYIRTKRPNDKVQVNFFRDGREKITKVELSKFETYALHVAGVEITNASDAYLENFDATYGVRILGSLSQNFEVPQNQFIIIGLDDQPVRSIKDVENIMKNKGENQPTKVTFKSLRGNIESYTFRP
ncbi:S1C family serine protease [Haloflavibacter putidus]|uniref:PDZ domain-containing protein n=1 Tax=Haloflavibacter putidus TaxID=2576776 RepID=A0A507ZTU5_9FLAO|nr:trypsin-like peptidase domain-containing protein [Haloflavibacter putidus]TQD39158.1 PDZ domain-containing protein [Haloflavibacter putidus]